MLDSVRPSARSGVRNRSPAEGNVLVHRQAGRPGPCPCPAEPDRVRHPRCTVLATGPKSRPGSESACVGTDRGCRTLLCVCRLPESSAHGRKGFAPAHPAPSVWAQVEPVLQKRPAGRPVRDCVIGSEQPPEPLLAVASQARHSPVALFRCRTADPRAKGSLGLVRV